MTVLVMKYISARNWVIRTETKGDMFEIPTNARIKRIWKESIPGVAALKVLHTTPSEPSIVVEAPTGTTARQRKTFLENLVKG